MRTLIKRLVTGLLLLNLAACQTAEKTDESKALVNKKANLRQQLAQKLILDFRYYCPESSKTSRACRQPMTELPLELAELIAKTDLGGVILFSDNLQNIEQIVKLNHELANTAKRSQLHLPLFISVDQEGGRVARLPRADSTAFTGSLSIAATYPTHGTKYAQLTGKILAQELAAVGFNLNYAPNADVNINPNNPVINVRSFGEDPQVVSALATAQLNAMQQQGILGTLKHFPGHGDTSVDSHTGLPRVTHDLAKIKQVDLAPFQHAIDNGAAKVIMTAHIQYPELDSSTFVSKSGKVMIKPATMSKAILTDLLRHQMQYQGLIITDALDMRGISQFFNQTEAVIETFNAGADIALMPIAIRSKQEIGKLHSLLDQLEQAVIDGKLDRQTIFESYQRVVAAKQQLPNNHEVSVQTKVQRAKSILALPEARRIEQQLARDSITLLKGSGRLLPTTKHLHLLMPDGNKCFALTNELKLQSEALKVTCSNFMTMDLAESNKRLAQADALLVASLTPRQSLAEMGGMDDLPRLLQLSKKTKYNYKTKMALKTKWLQQAKATGKQTLFVSLRMPYETKYYAHLVHHVLATYAYNQYQDYSGKQTGSSYRALAQLLTGKISATGQLPVTVNN